MKKYSIKIVKTICGDPMPGDCDAFQLELFAATQRDVWIPAPNLIHVLVDYAVRKGLLPADQEKALYPYLQHQNAMSRHAVAAYEDIFGDSLKSEGLNDERT